jgi:hypothetical protein
LEGIIINTELKTKEKYNIVIEEELTLFTLKDLQEIFHCGKSYAYELINLKGFPRIKIGRKIFVPKDRLMKWLKENMNSEIQL